MVRRINLLPQSERRRTSTDFGVLALLAVIIVAIFGMGFGYYLLHNTLGDRKQQLADLQQQSTAIAAQLATLKEYDRLQAQRASTESVVQAIYANRTLVANVLDAVSLVVPETAWFQSMSLTTSDPPPVGGGTAAKASSSSTKNDATLAIEGNTYSFEQVAQVLVRLQLVPELSGVSLQSAGVPKGATDPSQNIRGFSIGASVVNTQPTDTALPMSQVEVGQP